MLKKTNIYDISPQLDLLYKKNGQERYPEFKLYKMISRKVHNHIPSEVIKNSYFDRYKIKKKKIKKKINKINDIDILPVFYTDIS